MNENPYNPLQPTTDATRFYGRENALSFFQLNLAGNINQSALVLLGQRGIGKSSLLSQVPLHIDERYLFAWIDLSSFDFESDDQVTLAAAIVDQTRLAMESVSASMLRLPDFPDLRDENVDILAWLKDEFLDVALSAIRRERHLVIVLDSAHLLFGAVHQHNALPENFFDYLVELLQQYEKLNIIAGFEITFEEQVLKTSPFNDTLLHYRLEHLATDHAHQLITKPIENQLQYDPFALEYLKNLVGGHPFHIHSLCRLIYRLAVERGIQIITQNEIEAVIPASLEQTSDVMESLWDYARPNERLALTAMVDLREHNEEMGFPIEAIQDWLAKTDYPLSEVQLGAAIRGLVYLGLIEPREEGLYQFASGIQGNWLRTYTEVDTTDKATIRTPTFRVNRQYVSVIIGVLIVFVFIGAITFINREDESSTPNNAEPTLTLPAVATETPAPLPTKALPFGS